jgi:UDP-MurNAc hydroxylase
MRMTFFANACCLYECEGYSILCDPWLIDGAMEGSWCHYPPLKTHPSDLADVDSIYISHLHPDHFDPASLKYFSKDIPIIILDEKEHYLRSHVDRLGFHNIISIRDGHSRKLGPFKLTMYKPFFKTLFDNSEIDNLLDSALLVEANNFSIFNTNDNPPTLEIARKLRQRHGKLSLLQFIYNVAGPHPACCENLSLEEKKTAKDTLVNRSLKLMVDVAKVFDPDKLMPFAGSYVIGGKEWIKNEFLAHTGWDEAVSYIKEHTDITPLIMREKQTFDFENNDFTSSAYEPINKEEQTYHIQNVLSKITYPYETDVLDDLLILWLKKTLPVARMNLWRKQGQFKVFKTLNVYLSLNEELFQFRLDINDSSFVANEQLRCPYIKFSLDLRLLARILKREAHWNNAELGCHINYSREPDSYDPDLHLLMSFFHIPIRLGL